VSAAQAGEDMQVGLRAACQVHGTEQMRAACGARESRKRSLAAGQSRALRALRQGTRRQSRRSGRCGCRWRRSCGTARSATPGRCRSAARAVPLCPRLQRPAPVLPLSRSCAGAWLTRRARGARQETQKGDIALALEWMPVELDDD